jgi:predicted XRE-type DNA-binding protein
MGRAAARKTQEFINGSGTVFEDLGLANADELALETELLRRIINCLRARDLSQRQAGKILGIDQPKVSALMNGRVDGFSVTRLFRLLNALDMDVDIRVRPKPRTRSHARSKVAA